MGQNKLICLNVVPFHIGCNHVVCCEQKALKEKEEHIEQLLRERDLERSEVARAAAQVDEVSFYSLVSLLFLNSGHILKWWLLRSYGYQNNNRMIIPQQPKRTEILRGKKTEIKKPQYMNTDNDIMI